jgi:DNA-binding beta-propeller fold protein YncE
MQAVDVSPTPQGFTNLVRAYGILETIAGSGIGRLDNVSYWSATYEGKPAISAALSRPHIAMADRAGNVYIADKNSHSVLKAAPDGTIHTLAGTHAGGFNGEGPAAATTLQLNFPNGLWVRPEGTVYVLDTDNGRVRRVDTNGIMATLFLATSDGSALNTGRGLWVSDDESSAYFCAGTKVRSWTAPNSLQTLASGFSELGTLLVEPGGDLIVCDRGANYAYRMHSDGSRTVLAGNGGTNGGGDGFSALATGLYGIRSPWPVPTGGYLLLSHEGCQLWYLDSAGIIRLLLNGSAGLTHSGDGSFFYDPSGAKISEGRSVTMDYDGNILVCESDYGYIRRIRFQRIPPAN